MDNHQENLMHLLSFQNSHYGFLAIESAQKQAEEHIVLAFKALQQVPYNTADLQQLTQWIFKRSH